MKFVTLSHPEWRRFAPSAHKAVFGVDRTADYERCDWAVLAVSHDDAPLGFATVRELNQNEVYLQFGGIFEKFRNSPACYKALTGLLRIVAQNFTKARTFVEAENSSYLRLALKMGFVPCGYKSVNGSGFLELEIKLSGPEACQFQLAV